LGWFYRINWGLKHQFEKQANADFMGSGISIRVKEIPTAIFELKEIKNLEISFVDSIIIPDKLKEIKIEKLTLSGRIEKSEIERISKMFPDTELIINKEKMNTHNNH